MDHNLEGGAVEIVVNPNLSSGVIGNRLEGSLNLDRNIVVTADDDGRLTASTIQPEGSAFCLVCDNLIKDRRNVDVRHLFIADSVTLHTQQQVGTLLAHVLNVNHLDHEEVYSDVLCRRCGRLLDELDEVEQRSIVIRNKIQDWYNKSVVRRLKNPNDPSIEAYDDLDLSEDEAVTSVIKVKSAPVESDLDDDPLLDELRPEDQGIRADDPEFNPFYDVQRRQRGRGRGRGGRSRGRGRGRGRGRVGRPPKYGFTKYPPVSSTGSTVSAGEKFGQLVTKILGDEETSPMDTDIETEKGEVATNTDQQTEKCDEEIVGGVSCPYCYFKTITLKALQTHKTQMHKNLDCPHCGKMLSTWWAYERHIAKYHTTKEVDKMDKCYQNKDFSSGLIDVSEVIKKEVELKKRPLKIHECPTCFKIFKSRPALTYHISTKHPSRMYDCSVCSASFNHPSLLASHQLRHGERSLMCHKCGRKFFTQKQLNSHENHFHRHTRSYTCDVCGSKYSKLKVLQYHRRTHDKNKRELGDVQHTTDSVPLHNKKTNSQPREENLTSVDKDLIDSYTLEQKKMRICFNSTDSKETDNTSNIIDSKPHDLYSNVNIDSQIYSKDYLTSKTNVNVMHDEYYTLDRRKEKADDIMRIDDMEICMELAENEVRVCETPIDETEGQNMVIIVSSD